MDSLQHWAGLYFGVKAVTRFLADYRNRYGKHTKYVELEIALRFVLCLSRHYRKVYVIGFPTLHHLVKDKRFTPREVIDHKLALDGDVDIVIAPREKAQYMYHKLQIVRFTGDVEKTTQGLFDFLRKKKFNIPKDENLLLLVWLEKGMRLNYIELHQELAQIHVPYGEIFMVGETERNESKNFFCIQVFPEIKTMYLDLSFLRKQKATQSY